jgi:hypothetical protein
VISATGNAGRPSTTASPPPSPTAEITSESHHRHQTADEQIDQSADEAGIKYQHSMRPSSLEPNHNSDASTKGTEYKQNNRDGTGPALED